MTFIKVKPIFSSKTYIVNLDQVAFFTKDEDEPGGNTGVRLHFSSGSELVVVGTLDKFGEVVDLVISKER